MRVLVTGGAGYIGAHIVRTLADRGHEPLILDDFRRSRRERCGSFPVEAVRLEDAPSVLGVFERFRPEAVIHMSGYISVGESVRLPDMYWQNNLGASFNLFLALSRYPVKVFLFSSTAAVYGNAERVPIPESSPLSPTAPYGSSKLAFEGALFGAARVLGFRACALRYFNAAGAHPDWGVGEEHEPEEHLIPRVIRAFMEGHAASVYGNDYPTPDGTCVRDYIHVLDLASAHVAVIESEQLPQLAVFNAGTGSGFSVLEVISTVARHLGKKPTIEFLPRRPGDPAALVADATALGEAIGWKPIRSSLDEIVSTAIAWEKGRASR